MKKVSAQKTGNSVFITGAGRGLGLGLCRIFLEKGFTVFAGRFTVTKNLDDLAGPGNSGLYRIQIDVTETDSVDRAAVEVGSLTTGIDVLINNAAVCESEGTTVEAVDFSKAARIMDVNALGPLRVTKAFLPLLRRGGMKTIINVSSEAGSIDNCRRKGMFGYSMSKAALNMQSKLLDNYLSGDGFIVKSIHPGWMRTDMGGSNADIDPMEAARGIFGIVTGGNSASTGLFSDYNGFPLKF
jgi:NAD(P)-dependent dehydrogenase (short-subunit alcohol dehydrogenase family)